MREPCLSLPDVMLRRGCSSGELHGEQFCRLVRSASKLEQHLEPLGSGSVADETAEPQPRQNHVGSSPNGRAPFCSLSDGILAHVHRHNMRGDPALLRFASLPANLAEHSEARPSAPGRQALEPSRSLRLSQARLIIPRTISEYLDSCRFARTHSEGLLLAATVPDGVLANCRMELVPRALSEGLLGGRLYTIAPERRGPRQPQGPEEPPPPPPRIPAEDLKEGMVLEGRIVRIAGIGLFVDVGATHPGLLRRRDCRGVPRQLLQQGEVISNLVVLRTDGKKKRFSLALRGIGVDGQNLEEEAYDEILRRIANWAGVVLPSMNTTSLEEPPEAEKPPPAPKLDTSTTLPTSLENEDLICLSGAGDRRNR